MVKKKNDGVIKQWNSISTFGIVGNVIENNLKLDKEKKIDTITGSITIKFGDNSTDVVTVGAWQPEFFGTGTENQSFTKTLEAMETLVTLSQATPENPASVVIINNNDKDFAPKIDIDKYWDVKKGEFNEMTKAKLGMFTAIEINNSIKPEEFGSEFTVNTKHY